MNTNNHPKTILLVGPPGSGKGTQADFLRKTLGGETLYIYTGDRFRKLLKDEHTLTTKLLKEEVLDAGELAPTFLSAWAWSTSFVHELDATQHLLLDGSPRTVVEAYILDNALNFYNRTNALMISLEVPYDIIRERLIARGRHDDTEEVIKERFRLYKENIDEVITYVDTNAKSIALRTIDGVGTPEEIAERIKATL